MTALSPKLREAIWETLRDGAWFPIAVLIVGTVVALWWAKRAR